MGIGPRDIKRGDMVYLVAGAPTPFLFRRVNIGIGGGVGWMNASHLGGVRLVGSAYHGELEENTKISYTKVILV